MFISVRINRGRQYIHILYQDIHLSEVHFSLPQEIRWRLWGLSFDCNSFVINNLSFFICTSRSNTWSQQGCLSTTTRWENKCSLFCILKYISFWLLCRIMHPYFGINHVWNCEFVFTELILDHQGWKEESVSQSL